MTNEGDVESKNYQDLASQDKVSHIYLLDSHLYCTEGQEPELHEVSTQVKPLK
jgi:DNA sulfur modification protein DndD